MSNPFQFDENDRGRPQRDDEYDDAPPRRRGEADDGYDDPRPRRRKPGGGGLATVLRCVSPGTFGLAVLAFFLPWTDIGCSNLTGRVQVFTQSGYESATAKYSEGSGIGEANKQAGDKTGGKRLTPEDILNMDRKADDGPKPELEAAPLLWVYFALVVLGVVVPVGIGRARERGGAVLGFAGGALVVLTLAASAGFPLERVARVFNDKITKDLDAKKQVGGENGKGNEAAMLVAMMRLNNNYLIGFWLSVLALVASVAVGGVQLAMGGPKPPGSRRPPRDEPDDLPDD